MTSAENIAQASNSADSLYLWQWQTGRILKATGKTQRSIAAYSQSLVTLNSIRGDILAANKEVQFNFRDSVEPVYRQLIELLLQPTSINTVAQPADNIQLALNALDSLKLAELQNYFGDECITVAVNSKKPVNTQTAFIYSVILSDRTVIILQLPRTVSMVCDRDRPSTSVVYQAWIQRVAIAAEQSRKLQIVTSERDRARIYAESGFWYNALSALVKVYTVQPGDKSIQEDIISLLNQVGITKVEVSSWQP